MMAPKYRIGSVEGENVVVGDHGTIRIRVTADRLPAQAKAIQELRALITLISGHADQIKQPQQVQADAEAAKSALSKKMLDRGHIEELIRKITVGLAGVTALAGAVDAIQAAVTRLFT